MERRRLTGTDIDLSVLALGTAQNHVTDLARWRAAVRHALAAGVNLFDLTDVPLGREQYYLGPLIDPSLPLYVLLRRSGHRLTEETAHSLWRGPGREPGRSLGAELLTSLEAIRAASPSRVQLLLEWQLGGEPAYAAVPPEELTGLVREGVIAAWGIRASAPEEGALVSPVRGGAFTARALSILDPPPPEDGEASSLPLLVHDPLAGGLLDGSRFEGPFSPGTLPRAPRPMSEIRDEWAPTLLLDPLVRRGERTLAQASLRYVIDIVRATSTAVPLTDPRRLREALRYDASPELTPEEIHAVQARLPSRASDREESRLSRLRRS